MADPAAVVPVGNEGESDEERRRREQEEAMERLLLQQEQEQAWQDNLLQDNDDDHAPHDHHHEDHPEPPAMMNNNDNNNNNHDMMPPPQSSSSSPGLLRSLSYTQTSLFAALLLVFYALRTRQQWYLALVYIRSSKAAYIILANALIATCVGVFRAVTKTFLGGLRLHEAEGVGDFFRWNVTETCLALTMFRSELTVSNGILFLILVLAKCLHWVADLREGHLRVTEESIVVGAPGSIWQGWPVLQWQHAKLWFLLILLQVLDIFAVQWTGNDILTHGPSVSILFGFEAAILLVSAWNNLVLWHLHALDGWMHYLHEQTTPDQRMHRWIHPWKEHKATFTFAVEVQAQALKFLFYVIFFAIVLTYYGMPINLFREVYVSFQALKQRLVAFAKYRRLMASMNRFQSVTEDELEAAGRDCIICRDDMTINDCKKLPGCGHIFHKSCLREWLVQQQTCPTCRGDISAMEAQAVAEAARRAAAEARAAQEEEEEEMEAEEEETPESHPAQETTTTTEHHESHTTNPPPPPPVVEEQSPFPALYRVVKDEGADVWDEAHTAVGRTVPFGVVVLCQALQWKQEVGFMMQVPDGWVHEDTVVRVRTLGAFFNNNNKK
ncbi:protein ligase synoviolin [Seminavis robusta]|uniref:RING-type E3 ubiquitin transferase n=1 Tax=Seminavis robusta TaxID=568900 RepID=A0A9N8H4B0_9STRA|nr:protein ligase synoviolin [Seminavis robusta]|eukprot:Sro6_g005140.1 protein ligase synoviolin (610) ;mRNA; r:107665-109494